MTAPRGTRPDPVELRAWLTNRVAAYLRLPAPELDTNRQLAEYGLDSVYVLALCGDIEDHLNIQLDATVVWDYPTIDHLSRYLDQFWDQQPAADAR
jgi:acyl carrier protein